MNLKALDNLTPDYIRNMDNKRMSAFIAYIQKLGLNTVINRDMIKDRNDFRYCYNKLINQLHELGVEPCINYYTMNERKNKNNV